MKTKIIDGKKYIEYDAHKALRNNTIKNTVFLFLLSLAIITLIMAIATIVQNKEMLQSQPIDYIMDKYNFVSCSCTDAEGKSYRSSFNVIEVKEVAG